MTEEGWNAARERFCELARLRSRSHDPNFSEADRVPLLGFNALVTEWYREGVVKDILRPLLESEESAVRYCAAIFLMRMGAPDEALTVLSELESIGSFIAGEAERSLQRRDNGELE
ncbi:hypothetical protein [Amycolatopsis sp. lyj-23]|uniref:hypothetical protein n=1 Tax=Amycolatopsis sp. lyj-23 TaxID=2789283 RepID=UPI003979DB93